MERADSRLEKTRQHKKSRKNLRTSMKASDSR